MSEYLTKIQENHNTPESFQVIYLARQDGKNFFSNDVCKLKVVTENIGHLLNKKRIYHWLHYKYPDREFTEKEINRSFDIISLLMRKCDGFENEDCKIWKFYDDNTLYLNYSICENKRSEILHYFLSAPEAHILYTEPKTRKEKHFLFIDLLNDDAKYQIFKDYYSQVPDYETGRAYLKKKFNLPKDILDLIATYLTSEKKR
jgi:hypothetical protein